MLVLSASVEGLIEYFSKMLEMFGFESSKGIHIFIGEFKREILLELNSLSREITHEEPVVNMKDTTVLLDHYVAIMPILNLQEIGD